MIILLDCLPLATAGPDSEKTRLIISVAANLSRDRDIRWLLAGDPAGSFPVLPGATHLAQRVLPGRLGWRLWYDVQLPWLAKKHRAGGIMTTGGVAARTSLPQCIWMPERAEPKQGSGYPPVYARRLADTLDRGAALITYSSHDRDWLVSRDAGAAGRLIVLRPSTAADDSPSGAASASTHGSASGSASGTSPGSQVESPSGSPFGSAAGSPLSVEDREGAKGEFAQGREYFFADARFAGGTDMVQLLKAFSLFKKRQLSNLQLVILGGERAELQERLETYKYREDVHWLPSTASQGQRLMSGAYAGLFLFEGPSLGTPVLEAWGAGVPVLLSAGGCFREGAGEAALTADPADLADLAAQLMAVYKDEALRSRLISQGLSRVAEFDVEHRKSLESIKLRLAKLYYDNLLN